MTKGEKKKVGCHPLDSGGFLVKVEDGTINLTHFFSVSRAIDRRRREIYRLMHKKTGHVM